MVTSNQFDNSSNLSYKGVSNSDRNLDAILKLFGWFFLNLKVCKNMIEIILASILAKCYPIQFLGPELNGRK